MSPFLKPFALLLSLTSASTFLYSSAIAAAASIEGDIFVRDEGAPFNGIVSEAAFKHWLATTDAELNFIGEPILDNPLDSRAAQNVMVTYCTNRVNNVCGGTCNIYNAGPTCLNAPGTACLAATSNVGFCDHSGCSGSCNQLSSCGTRLDNGFCATPGTKSIVVGS